MNSLLLVFAIVPVLLSGRPVWAASGYAGEFLALGAGARSMALGSAYVALADDATAGYWNPAGLESVGRRQAHLMHAQRYGGMVSHDFLALAGPWRRDQGLAVSLVRIGVDDIHFTELQDPGQPLSESNRPVIASTHSSADYALYLSYGRRLHPRLTLGASLKGIYRSVGAYSARGIGVDAGARVELHQAVHAALVVRDATTTPVAWSTDTTDRIHPSLLAGMAYTTGVASGRLTTLLAARIGGDAADAGDARPLHAGLEYVYRQLALRAGLEEGRQAFGFGLRLNERIQLDFAYAQHDELESIQQVSAVIGL